MSDLFLEATKNHDRVQSPKGLLTPEQLWDIPLQSKTGATNLDDLAKEYNRRIQDKEQESFVVPQTTGVTTDRRIFDLILLVIKEKQQDQAKEKTAKDNKARKELILRALEQKEIDAITSASEEDLKKELAKL